MNMNHNEIFFKLMGFFQKKIVFKILFRLRFKEGSSKLYALSNDSFYSVNQ